MALRYMIYPHAHPKDQVNLWLQIHTGSLQEEDNERGVAHFVEHMMFNGTKHGRVIKSSKHLSQWACVLVAMLMPIPAMTKRGVSGEFADYAETKSATSDGNLQ